MVFELLNCLRNNMSFSDVENQARNQMADYFCQVAETFGLPRSVALIYQTFFLAEEPLTLGDVLTRSELSKGSVSTGLRLLERMKFILSLIHI